MSTSTRCMYYVCLIACVCVWLLLMCRVSIAASIFLCTARINLLPVVSKTQRRCLEVPVGVSGVMGVQVSLVPVRRTSWLFFPSLKIPRSTTLSLPSAKHAGNMLDHTGLEHWLWCSREIDFHFGKVKAKPIAIESKRFLSLHRADCWNVMLRCQKKTLLPKCYISEPTKSVLLFSEK